MSAATKRKVLVIGWDAADWKAIDPLMDAGLMPNLERLVNAGVRGHMATLDPPLSPMLWTSIATGKRPYKHGILGFTEASADGRSIRPVTNVHRKVKAIWNILTQEKLRTHVIGWWPSHPAEPVNGIMISNFYQRAHRPINEPWVMREGTVHPAAMSLHFGDLRIHPAELTAAHIAPFVPGFATIDQDKEKSLEVLARIIADCSTVHGAATYILEHEAWDFMGVYYDAIDHFKHAFMKFHPPRREHIAEREFELYKGVVTAAYRYHDLMLGRLLALAGDDATVMLISDHGFHPDHLRPRSLPREPAGPAHEHSPFGIFCLKGPGIKKDALVAGASLLDITPTLLTLFDRPVARDMDGKPLVDVFEVPPQLRVIDSWETVEGEAGMHPRTGAVHAFPDMDKESLQQLVDLGYIEDPGTDAENVSMRAVRENRYYLARAYVDGGKVNEAIEVLEEIVEEAPAEIRYGLDLAHNYLRAARADEARATMERVKSAHHAEHDEAVKKYQEQKEKSEAATMEGVEGEKDGKQEKKPVMRDPGPYRIRPALQILEASIMQAEGRHEEALALLERMAIDPKVNERVQLLLGNAHLKLGHWKEAHAAFEQELVRDHRSVSAYHGLGICCLHLDDPAQAVDHLHQAINLRFNLPTAHYHLGEAYFRMERFDEALQAYRVCLKMAPHLNRARMRAARILEEHLGEPEKGAALRAEIRSHADQEVITVVSGLPRSGTSLMMQALVRGGMTAFTDAKRPADDSNPKGYFEHEAVKGLARDANFLDHARGHAVKVVAQLLPFLPPRYRYRVVFMERDIHEVIPSQMEMLKRDGKKRKKMEGAFPLGLHNAFLASLKKVERWQARSPNVDLIRVSHAQVIADPAGTMARVNAFLGGTLDEVAMAAVVDPTLHRERFPATARIPSAE